MKSDGAEEARAKRAVTVIYVVMAVGMALPFLLWWLLR
jgi:hypothetical protein